MQIDNLQELVNEVILNGVSIDAINYLYLALVAFLSSIFGAFWGAFYKKRGEEKSIKASFNDVIQRLEQTTKLTEEIKVEVGKSSVEHQIKFGKLHEKRIEVIEGLYHRLEIMEQKGREFIHYSSPSRELDEKFKHADESINDFISYSKLNKFWVDKELFDQIEKIALFIDRTVHENIFACGVSPEDRKAFVEAMEQRKISVEKISKDIPEAKSLLVNSIRKTLDPNEN